MKILKIINSRDEHKAIQAALKILKSGGVVAHPTDTVYGLAADSSSLRAVKKVHALKKSNSAKPLLLIVPNKSYLSEISIVSKLVRNLIKKFWPGPLALILPSKKDSGSIGVRYPDHQFSRKLVRAFGRPIVTTSANLSGDDPARSATDVLRIFGNQRRQPDLILDDGSCSTLRPSTIIDCRVDPPSPVRRGAVSYRMIQKCVSRQ